MGAVSHANSDSNPLALMLVRTNALRCWHPSLVRRHRDMQALGSACHCRPTRCLPSCHASFFSHSSSVPCVICCACAFALVFLSFLSHSCFFTLLDLVFTPASEKENLRGGQLSSMDVKVSHLCSDGPDHKGVSGMNLCVITTGRGNVLL